MCVWRESFCEVSSFSRAFTRKQKLEKEEKEKTRNNRSFCRSAHITRKKEIDDDDDDDGDLQLSS